MGWTGANCVKWLDRITVLAAPHRGFFMDSVYRLFQKGEDPRSGRAVALIDLKSIIFEPLENEEFAVGPVPIRGAAYAGEARIGRVEVSVDGGLHWHAARLVGPDAGYAWRHWEFLWHPRQPGCHTLMSRATDTNGRRQPQSADWNVLGYGNNGVREHAVSVTISE
jgi:DMSO/TMAO reductase YedYZ molybdopterin-dependent catalytic subunit